MMRFVYLEKISYREILLKDDEGLSQSIWIMDHNLW